MQSANLAFVIEQAGHHRSGFGKAVRDSVEVGVVVPSILRKELQGQGFVIVDDKTTMAEYGFASMAVLKRVAITAKNGDLVAMGAAGDHDEALLHAALGWFREHPSGDAEVPAGIAVAPNRD